MTPPTQSDKDRPVGGRKLHLALPVRDLQIDTALPEVANRFRPELRPDMLDHIRWIFRPGIYNPMNRHRQPRRHS